jgi:hypothetical protein
MEQLIMKIGQIPALVCLVGALSVTTAYADECSGRDHTTGTVIGAAGGAAIGSVASHNAGGAIAGAVLGGLAGNAIARSEDCTPTGYRNDGRGQSDSYQADSYYGRGYVVGPDENDYWGVESYSDFGEDYRHISMSIDRARDHGSLRDDEARRFSRRLQQIQYRADWQQRHRRFDPQDIEAQLGQLREDMRSARRENREEQGSQFRDGDRR